jgi:drug/metabolite transporter (DMT)-like permease
MTDRAARRHGLALAATSASLFSFNTVCARIAFDAGANATAGNAARFAFAAAVFGLLLVLRRGGARLSGRQRLAAAALAVPVALSSFGYLGAVEYIPVSTAVLVVYTYPIWVALIARQTRGEPLGGARVVAIVLAFAGVALALDVHASAMPDVRGLALAALAAIGMASMVLGSSRLVRDIDPGAVNFYMALAATGIFVVLLLVGGPHLPHSALGHLGFAGLLVTFPLAQLALLAAVDRAGPVVTAVVMNLEPLITIGLAVIVLGEHVSAVQLGGAALVVAAIAIMRRQGPRLP